MSKILATNTKPNAILFLLLSSTYTTLSNTVLAILKRPREESQGSAKRMERVGSELWKVSSATRIRKKSNWLELKKRMSALKAGIFSGEAEVQTDKRNERGWDSAHGWNNVLCISGPWENILLCVYQWYPHNLHLQDERFHIIVRCGVYVVGKRNYVVISKGKVEDRKVNQEEDFRASFSSIVQETSEILRSIELAPNILTYTLSPCPRPSPPHSALPIAVSPPINLSQAYGV